MMKEHSIKLKKQLRKLSQDELLEFPTTVIIVQGTVGSGKTLLATFLAKYYHSLGLPAYSNYRVKGFESLDNFLKLREIFGAVVVVDDAVTEGLDSYQQMSSSSRLHTRLFQYVRKKRLVMIFTQQVPKGLALRIRHIANYIFEPQVLIFPYFKVRGYLQNGSMFMDRVIKFLPSVYDDFDTLQVVMKPVDYGELYKLYQECNGNATLYRGCLTLEYGFTSEISKLVCESVKTKNIPILEFTLNHYGYELKGAS